MPENLRSLAGAISVWRDDLLEAILLASVGMLISIGQSLAHPEPLPWRIIIGRSISVGGLSVAAGSILILVPGLPMIAVIGVSSLLASLGTGGLERLLVAILTRRAAP